MSAFIAFIKSIPGMVKLFNYAIGLLDEYRMRQLDKKFDRKRDEVDSVLKRIEKAKTDEERKRLLIDFDKL